VPWEMPGTTFHVGGPKKKGRTDRAAALNLPFHVQGIDLQALLNHDLSG